MLCDVLVLPPNSSTDISGFRGIGLIDTGATVSGIGPRAIQALALKSYGKRPLGSATEERMVDYYLFRLALEPAQDGDTPAWPFPFDRIEGFSWLRATDFDVIIGMDVLSQCDLSLFRHKACTLSFG